MATYTGSDSSIVISSESTQYIYFLNPQKPIPIKQVGSLNNQGSQPQLDTEVNPSRQISQVSTQYSYSVNPQIPVPEGFKGMLDNQPSQTQLAGALDFLKSHASDQLQNPLIDNTRAADYKGAIQGDGTGDSTMHGHGSIISSNPSAQVPNPMVLVPSFLKGILDNQPTGQTQLSARDDFNKSNASAQSPNPQIPENQCLIGTLPVQPYPQTQLTGIYDFLRSGASSQIPNPQIIIPHSYVGILDNQPPQIQLVGTSDFLSSHASSQIPNPQIIVPIGFMGALQGQPAQVQLVGHWDFASSKATVQFTNPLIDNEPMRGYTQLQPYGQLWLSGRAFRFLSSPGWDVYARYDSTITLVQSAPGQVSYDMTITLVSTVSYDEQLLLVNTVQYDETLFAYVTMSYDQRLCLWKSTEQPLTDCVLTEIADITSTIGKIVIEHPAIKKIEFYDTDNVLIGSESDLTNLQKGKIVTRSMSILNVNRTLKYILVTTADNKVHTIYV